MPVDITEVLDILSTLCDDANLRVAVKESLKSGLIAGTATTIGALIGGPVGVAVGGAIGVSTATYFAQGKFKPVSQVIKEMSRDKKQILYEKAMDIVQGLGVEDAALFGKLVFENPGIKRKVLGEIVNHVSGCMHLQIID